METLKPYAQKMLYDIFNNLGIFPVNNRTFINNLRFIYNHIINGDYVQTSKRDRLIIISNVLKALNYTKEYNFIYEKAKLYNDEFLNNEYNQQLSETEKKNYITYDELLNKLKELISVYNDNPTDNNIKNVLIMALYTLQPPLRNDYYNMKIIYKDSEETDKKQNYILSINDSYYVIINNDKVINSHGRGEFIITNRILKNILNVYLKTHHPQNVYLFQNKDGTPYTKKQIQYIINKMFKSINKTLTIYNLRSAYITDFYNNNLDILSRSELADSMRHTKNTAELTYFKFM
jgi:hypothetical protein